MTINTFCLFNIPRDPLLSLLENFIVQVTLINHEGPVSFSFSYSSLNESLFLDNLCPFKVTPVNKEDIVNNEI